jgi:quinol monooxygenase YgiN
MICVTTRFHLRYFWQLLPVYFLYRGMLSDLQTAPGLIRYAFLVENPRVCYTFSIWESQQCLEKFSNVSHHIHAVRRAKKLCQGIWSAYWHFDAISEYANIWSGFPTWPALTAHPSYPYRLVQATDQEVL